jgi:hypothetical protein
MGSALGSVPGIGGSIIDWIAYGHALRTEKGAMGSFGHGDVRGVIASESANNAKEGGALVPTVAFGVPGSAGMAILLGAFMTHGLTPGPDMLTKHLDLTYSMVWSIAIWSNQFAKLATLRYTLICPVVLTIIYIGAFEASRSWTDLYFLLFFGVLGWTMKQLKWPRPPLILGFVLGQLIERYMFISVERYQWGWLLHPIVLAMLAITFWGLFNPLIKQWWTRRKQPKQVRNGNGYRIAFRRHKLGWSHSFVLFIATVFVAALTVSSQWEFGARLVPQVVAWIGLAFTILFIGAELFVASGKREAGVIELGSTSKAEFEAKAHEFEEEIAKEVHFDIAQDFGDMNERQIMTRAAMFLGWCVFFALAGLIIGLLPVTLMFLVLYMRFWSKESWKATLWISGLLWAFYYVLFHVVLVVPWPQSLMGEIFPILRTTYYFNLF